MKEVRAGGLGKDVVTPEMHKLANATAHRVGDLPRIGDDDDATASSDAKVGPGNALEKERIQAVGEKNGNRILALPAELSRARHRNSRSSVASARSRTRRPE